MGTIATSIDKEKDLTVQTLSGDITASEIIQKIEEYYAQDPTVLTLWDFREASLKAITAEDVRMFAQIVRTYAVVREGGKTALVFSSELGFGLGRMYDIFQNLESSMVTNMVFRDMQKAIEWLMSP